MGLLVEGPIDAAAVEAEVRTPAAGAVVLFVGTAREETGGKKVLRLFYEAYATMACCSSTTPRRGRSWRWRD